MQRLVAIGASTGGIIALHAVLSRLPADLCPILVVQHTLPGFSGPLADQLNDRCPMQVVEAADGVALEDGTAYIAPSGRHLCIDAVRPPTLKIRLEDAPAVHFHKPSIDALFQSLAELRDVRAVAVLLTGMGRDGAQGMLELRRAGADTIAQDERSSVIYGMPKEAVDRGAARYICSLDDLPDRILACLATALT